MTATLEEQLRDDRCPENPMDVLAQWLNDAQLERQVPNPNAMVLASAAGQAPSARVVLCKDIDAAAGFVVFYTNYESRKGEELVEDAPVACVFHWDHAGRQIRLEGVSRRSPSAESDAYFHSRHWHSQLGAWASAQSQPIDSRDALAAKLQATADRFGVDPSASTPPTKTIPRPPHWGGVRIWVSAAEIWLDGHARLHDRFRYTRTLDLAADDDIVASNWQVARLQP